ncbi:hypothetical protein ACFL1R_09510 [Candidatus Latescibacterota bacterium]
MTNSSWEKHPVSISRREFLEGSTRALSGAALLASGSLVACSDSSENVLKIDQEGNDILFTDGKAVVCRIPSTAAADTLRNKSVVEFDEIKPKIVARRFHAGIWDVEDRIRRTAPDLFVWQRKWRNTSDNNVNADLFMEVESDYTPEFTLIPALSYDGNTEHGGGGPKGLTADGTPRVFSGYRSTVLGGSYSEGDGWSIFLFASSQGSSIDCAFSLAPEDNHIVHRLLWPWREYPSRSRNGEYRETLVIEPGQSFETMSYLVLREAAEQHKSCWNGLDHAWNINSHQVKVWFSPKRIWDLSIQFGHESLWHEQSDFVGFLTGAGHWNPKLVMKEIDGRQEWNSPMQFEIGWVGQAAALGSAMLQDYLWNNNEESLQKSEISMDFWAKNARLKCGLFYTHFDMKRGMQSWGAHNRNFLDRPSKPSEKGFLDTCNLGHGMYHYLLASELVEKCGKPKPLWREVGLDACNFFLDHPLSDGTYGKAWSPEGECLAEGSTTGAYVLWPMVKAYRMTGDNSYLESARRAFRTYVDRDLKHMHCWGAAIDQNCIDKESCWPLLMAALDLYEITGEKEYLRDAEMAGYYLASWHISYSMPFLPESPLGVMKFDSYACTRISVGLTGQDPWGALMVLTWLRLAKATNNEIWFDRAIQTWGQASIGVSDGTLVVKGLKRPAGSQNEMYSYSLGKGKQPYGDANHWLPAWPTVFRLVTLMHWPTWEDLEVG